MTAGAAVAGRLYLAIDQGGHSSRALVFDGCGQVCARGAYEVGIQQPSPGWVEQDPEALVSSIHTAIGQALAVLGERRSDIAAAGLATQRASIVCWDRFTGRALSPVISWQDRRAAHWLEQFSTQAPFIHRLTGLMLSPHYGAGKLRWCLDHLTAVQSALENGTLAWGPLASFLLFRLVGERPLLVDPANAARTLLWNLGAMDWEPRLLQLFGLPAEPLPACVPTRHDFGRLSLHGMEVPLTIVSGDQNAALFAQGEPSPDTAYINIGTGAFVLRSTGQQVLRAERLLTGIAKQEDADASYVIEGTVNGAAAALDWFAHENGVPDWQSPLPGWLARRHTPPLFLNGVAGLGSPYWAPDFASRFIGRGETAARAVAVVESVLFLLRVNMDEIGTLLAPPAKIHVSGGLASLDGVCQRLADLSGTPVYRPAEREATARGIACLLAHSPRAWVDEQAGDRFTPGRDDELRGRYRKWQAALVAALGRPHPA